jgi:hypothetical protein
MTAPRKPRPRPAAPPRLSLRAVGIVLAVAVVATPLALLGGRAVLGGGDDLDRTITRAGFYPLAPPSKLVMPGSLYHVSRDGRFYTTICRAEDADVAPYTQMSETQDLVANALTTGSFELDTTAASEINARLNGNLVSGVHYSFRDVVVLEIPLDRNAEVLVKLTARKPCHEVVQRLLARGELVCQGQAVLRATVEYSIVSSGDAAAVAALVGTTIKAALEGALKTSVAFENGRLISGVGLNYGVRVDPVCLALPTDDLPRTLPPVRAARVAMLAQ